MIRSALFNPALLFVIIWSSGFIVARAVVPLADPNLFLSVRFVLCTLIFSIIAVCMKLSWPPLRTVGQLIGMGALVQGLYLGLGYWAVAEGLQPGVMALIGTLQPPLTAAVAARVFGERLSVAGRIGLLLGVIGIALAVWPAEPQARVPPWVLLAGLGSVLTMTAGTLLQKTSVVSVDLVVSSAWQNAGAAMTTMTLALLFREHFFTFNSDLLLLLAYAVLVLSLGGTTLLLWLLRNGTATRASSLLFLVPPMAALMAYQFFDERLTVVQGCGFAVAVCGVMLANLKLASRAGDGGMR